MTALRKIIPLGGALFAAALASAALTTGGPEFEPYQAIITRQPFGEILPSETSAVAVATSAPTESLTRELEMRAIIDDGDNRLRAGFLDKKSNKTFYLGVGEKNDFYELVSVNYDNEEAVLKRGDQTTVFSLRPMPTNAAAPGLAPAPGGLQGFAPLGTTGAEPPRGFAPVPLSEARQPFFSDSKKRSFSPFKPLGTNAASPFQTQSLESFMKANTNAFKGFSGAARPFGAPARTNGAGDTIDSFLRANPDAARKFSPFKPPDPNATGTELPGSAPQGFVIQESDPPAQIPNFFSPAPAADNSENLEE